MRVLFTAQDSQTIRDALVEQNQIANMPGFTLPPSHAGRLTRSTTCH